MVHPSLSPRVMWCRLVSDTPALPPRAWATLDLTLEWGTTKTPPCLKSVIPELNNTHINQWFIWKTISYIKYYTITKCCFKLSSFWRKKSPWKNQRSEDLANEFLGWVSKIIEKSDGPVDIHNSQIRWGRSQRGKAFHITSPCLLFLTTFYHYKQSSFPHINNLRPMGTRTPSLSEFFCPVRLTDDTRRSLSQRDDNPPVRRTEAGPIRHLTPGNIHPDSPDRQKQ